MYKAVIFDLDGTLIHTDQTVSDRALNAIDKCRERGMKILLATARPERTAEMYCNMIDFDAKVMPDSSSALQTSSKFCGVVNTSKLSSSSTMSSAPASTASIKMSSNVVVSVFSIMI